MKQTTQIAATSEEAIALALKKLGKTREEVDIQVLQEGKKGFLGIGARSAHVIVRVKEEPKPVAPPIAEPVIEEVKPSQPIVEQPIVVEELPTTPVQQEVVAEAEEEPAVQAEPSIVEAPKKIDDTPLVKEVTEAYLKGIAEAMDIHDLHVDMHKKGKTLYVDLSSKKAALLIGKRGHTLNALQQLTQLVVNKQSNQYITILLDVENYRDRREEALETLASRMAEKAVRTGKKVTFEPMPSYERKVIHNVLSGRVDIETFSEGAEPNRYLVIQPVK
ncbi:MAG: protein jag [Caryophanon sp.]|nr:protein jag [Caryophanon sp.]